MKKLIFLVVFFFIANWGYSQDTIITMNNDKIPVFIKKTDDNTITFIAESDSMQKENTISRKYLKGIIKDAAPLGTNIIIFKADTMKGKALFLSVAHILQKHGFVFEKVDKDFLTLQTKMDKVKKSYNVQIIITVEGNEVFFRCFGVGDIKGLGLWGYGSVSMRENYNYRGIKKHGKKSFPAFAFNYTENIAKECRQKFGGKLLYSKE